MSGTILAVLAVVGGVDTRPRLGGQVMHETFELGTVARITPKGKIHVQFETNKLRVCRLTELTVVSEQCPPSYNLFLLQNGSQT